ncbi:MAG: DoxX family protein [Flavobacteriaceae bacterium]|nr:MAG: DoxX family protein [Flavobacteriaceae bacterium]
MKKQYIKLFLRAAIAIGFLSAVGDRFGIWSTEVSAWGNWNSFVAYTKVINSWAPDVLIDPLAILATAAEVLFALCLLLGFKTELFARLSGFLLLSFAMAMFLSVGIKPVLDYSVLTTAAAAFGLSLMQEKHLEIDGVLKGEYL